MTRIHPFRYPGQKICGTLMIIIVPQCNEIGTCLRVFTKCTGGSFQDQDRRRRKKNKKWFKGDGMTNWLVSCFGIFFFFFSITFLSLFLSSPSYSLLIYITCYDSWIISHNFFFFKTELQTVSFFIFLWCRAFLVEQDKHIIYRWGEKKKNRKHKTICPKQIYKRKDIT